MKGDEHLVRLAELHHVLPEYVDDRHERRIATAEALRGVLAGLGVSTRDPARAYREAVRLKWTRFVEPVAVAWEGAGELLVRLPSTEARGSAIIAVTTADGETLSHAVDLEGARVTEREQVAGTEYVALALPLPLAAPDGLPLGYHQAEVEVARGPAHHRGTALVLSAPQRAYEGPRAARARREFGVFAPVYALHSERSHGAGDLGDLRRLGRWVAEQGGATVATLPVLAAFLDGPVEISPYAPVSRLAWNELYLELEALPEWQASAEARALVTAERWQARRQRLRKSALVDAAGVFALRKPVLEALAAEAFERLPARRAAIERFALERPELADYARFRGAVRKLGADWRTWPSRQRGSERGGGAAGAGVLTPRDYEEADYRYHLYSQFALHEQLSRLRREAGLPLGPYLDFPLGAHAAGFDSWRERASMAPGVSAGAPPDSFSTAGQDWGFPALHPGAGRDAGYRPFIAALRNHMRYAGMLRIDHVMGLHRLYVVPRGARPSEGAYIRYEPEELWAIVAIESRRARTRVVGEDLGTVPPEVRTAMRAHGVAGMHMFQHDFAEHPVGVLPRAPAGTVASLNTHDTPTFAGWLHSNDTRIQRRLGLLDAAQARAARARRRLDTATIEALPPALPATASDAIKGAAPALLATALRELGAGEAGVVIASLEDLLGSTETQNVPGTVLEQPNWRRRLSASLEEIESAPDVAAPLRVLRAARAKREAR